MYLWIYVIIHVCIHDDEIMMKNLGDKTNYRINCHREIDKKLSCNKKKLGYKTIYYRDMGYEVNWETYVLLKQIIIWYLGLFQK